MYRKRLKKDKQTISSKDSAAKKVSGIICCDFRLHAAWPYRIAYWFWFHMIYFPGRVISHLASFIAGIGIYPGVKTVRRFFIDHGMEAVTGETALISDDVLMYQRDVLSRASLVKEKSHLTSEDSSVVVGSGAVVLKAVTVGDSVVIKSIPKGATVVGVPVPPVHNGKNGHNELQVREIRKHFFFRKDRRTVTNNAATTQVPHDLLRLHASLARKYENVHRGQSKPSLEITALLEESYQTVADFINAPSIRNLVFYRNTTEAINSVMYALLTEFRDGDNMVTTMMEHNSNYVPWYAMCRDILPRFGINVECRIANFDQESGELDLSHMDKLIDSRTKLVCCTGASNFLGYKSPIPLIRELSRNSGYSQPDGTPGSYLLIDGAQLVPSTPVDVQQMNVDFLAFSFHKMLAPFGTGVLYAREELLDSLPPFLYGGDMIAEGQVHPESVSYNKLPWKYTAGTPNILGNIVSAQALRLILDFALKPDRWSYFRSDKKIEQAAVKLAMGKVNSYLQWLTREAIMRMADVPGIKIYGPVDVERRAPLISFNINGINPITLANKLAERGVEVRAGCHCATLAHHYLELDPPASCRLSFYIYNNIEDIEKAVDEVKRIALTTSQRTLSSYLKDHEHKLRGIRRTI